MRDVSNNAGYKDVFTINHAQNFSRSNGQTSYVEFPKHDTLLQQFKEIWQYRELAIELFLTYLKLRYVGSFLGFAWTMLNPVMNILTYWVVFSFIMRMGLENYPIFLIPGYLAWNFTYNSVINASESILSNKYLITKISFPSEILTIANVGVLLVDFIISLALYLVVCIILPTTSLSISMIALPLVVIMQIIFTVGLSMLIACISVFFLDVPKLVPVFGTIGFFLTPIFYPIEYIPEHLQKFLNLNPMMHFITIYHDILYRQTWPQSLHLVVIIVISLLMFVIGINVFRRKKHDFAELT